VIGALTRPHSYTRLASFLERGIIDQPKEPFCEIYKLGVYVTQSNLPSISLQ
jgi:hypothetical protein